MLVLSRKAGETVVVGKDIHVTVLEVRGNRVKLGFECPAHVTVHRKELAQRMAGAPTSGDRRESSQGAAEE